MTSATFPTLGSYYEELGLNATITGPVLRLDGDLYCFDFHCVYQRKGKHDWLNIKHTMYIGAIQADRLSRTEIEHNQYPRIVDKPKAANVLHNLSLGRQFRPEHFNELAPILKWAFEKYAESPDEKEVLAWYASHISGSHRPFEAWAIDRGYSPDSRKVEQIYRECSEALLKLNSFVGNEAAEMLANIGNEI